MITLKNDGRTLHYVVAGPNGHFQLRNATPGKLEILAHRTGALPPGKRVGHVELVAGQATTFDIELAGAGSRDLHSRPKLGKDEVGRIKVFHGSVTEAAVRDGTSPEAAQWSPVHPERPVAKFAGLPLGTYTICFERHHVATRKRDPWDCEPVELGAGEGAFRIDFE
jgi:hypothetical protein